MPMKDFKRLLLGLIIFLLVILFGVLTWLFINNTKNANPLPILASDSVDTSLDTQADVEIASDTLYVQAQDSIQVPLDNVIVRFEARYPRVQVLTHYVPIEALLTLPNSSELDHQNTAFIFNTDIMIANSKISQSQLAPLQSILNAAQSRQPKDADKPQANGQSNDSPDNGASQIKGGERNLVAFSYALKRKQSVDGVVLTNNPTAITFRNFLLSSTGQDILKQYDYNDIDNYKNSVDDLFNPSSSGNKASTKGSVEVTDALINGK